MGKYEVTQAEWQAVMGTNPSSIAGANRPVETVSWVLAMNSCAASNRRERTAGRLPLGYQYRLPTEAKWEYCCRARTTTEWNVGTSLSCTQANIRLCVRSLRAFGGDAANAWGLHDMHGNVAEWCLDSDSFVPNYPSGPVSDP